MLIIQERKESESLNHNKDHKRGRKKGMNKDRKQDRHAEHCRQGFVAFTVWAKTSGTLYVANGAGPDEWKEGTHKLT